MSQAERRLRLVFTGEDNTGHAVKSVSESLKDLKGAVLEGKESLKEERQAYSDSVGVLRERQRQERALGLEFKENHSRFFKTAQVVNDLGRVGLRANQIWQNYNLTQLRLRDVNKEVRDSYRSMQEAIKENGLSSDKARQAIERYNDSVEEQKRLNAELPAQYATMALAVGSLAQPIAKSVKDLHAWRASAQIASKTAGATAGDLAVAGTSGALLGKGLLGKVGGLGRLGGVVGKGGLLGAVAIAGLTAGGFLGAQGLKAVYGEKEGEERLQGVLGQLGIKGMLDSMSGNGGDEGVSNDNSISIGQVNIYTNDVKTAEDLRRSLQAEAMRQQSES